VAEGHLVHGAIRGATPSATAQLSRRVRCHPINLLRRSAVDELMRAIKPEWVFHLAAASSPAKSWDDPAGTLHTNLGCQANVLAAASALKTPPALLVVGSGDEYGEQPDHGERAITEEAPLRPLTPYGVSKVGQDLLGLQYFLSLGLPVVRVRPFNHTGPRQLPTFAIPSFARQVARMEAGRQPPTLRVGNLDARRDFTDVRDMVRAYRLAIEQGRPGEVYNLGAGQAPTLRQVVELLLPMSRVPITVEVDPARTHAVEVSTYWCDATKFRRLTGWQPAIPLDRTLRDTLDYWRLMERN
jgi:GDP-4-dehydro-6-deoxy-D-mannose reductase